MVDFIKLIVINPKEVKRLWEDPELSFYQYSEKSSRYDRSILNTKKIRQYKSEDVLIGNFNSRLEVAIKPHYLANNGTHNADDFSVTRSIETLTKLLEDLGIEQMEHYKVINLEYGVNLVVPNQSEELIRFWKRWKRYETYSHKEGYAFAKMSYSFNRHGKANTEKLIKFYHKHKQKGMSAYCHPDTLRFEVRTKKSRYINTLGILHLGNLLSDEVYTAMGDDLLKVSKELLFLDHNVYLGNLSKKDQDKLRNYYLNEYTWEKLINDSHRNTFPQNKVKYFELLDKTTDNIHTIFRDTVNEKVTQLLTSKDVKCANVPTPKKYANVHLLKGEIAHFQEVENTHLETFEKNGGWYLENLEVKIKSMAAFRREHNYLMLRLIEMGVPFSKNKKLTRRVRALIVKLHSHPEQYRGAIERIKAQLQNEYQTTMSIDEIHYLVTKSRRNKRKKTYSI